MTEKKFIRIRREPFWIGGEEVIIDEKNYYIKYKGCSKTDAMKEAEKLISRFHENIKHKNIKGLEIKAKIR